MPDEKEVYFDLTKDEETLARLLQGADLEQVRVFQTGNNPPTMMWLDIDTPMGCFCLSVAAQTTGLQIAVRTTREAGHTLGLKDEQIMVEKRRK